MAGAAPRTRTAAASARGTSSLRRASCLSRTTRSSPVTKRPTGCSTAARRSIRTRARGTCTHSLRARGTSASRGRSTWRGSRARSPRTSRSGRRSTRRSIGTSCSSRRARWARRTGPHYQTLTENGPGVEDNTCSPSGTTGQWHAASGNSGGWKQWSIDLSAYRGKQVELSVVFATDWAVLPVPGVMVDDATVTAGGNVSSTSFESQGDLGGWTVPGAHPEGPSSNVNDWIQSDRIPFEDAAVTRSDFGLMFGFGLEGVKGAGNRAVLMDRIVDDLQR